MEHWPALSRWQSPGYLLGVAGQRTVPVEVGSHYLEEGWGQQLMPLEAFLARHILPRPDSPSCPALEGGCEAPALPSKGVSAASEAAAACMCG